MTIHNEEVKETSPLSGKPHGFKRLFRQLVPYGFCYEAKQQIGMAIPVFLSQTMLILILIVSSVFCGHLGKIELDSVMLASAVINISGITIGTGMIAACDTLMSQTYGSKNLKRVGTIMQRGILILMLCCFPCWAILMNTEQLLLLCKQNPDIARLTQKYVMIFLPGLPAVFLHQLQSKYLQNQRIMWPQCLTGFVVNIMNVIVNAIFMYIFRMGVEGSAWTNTISQWAMSLTLFLYIVSKKLHVETWGGWSADCLQEWDLFLRLAIPSLLMVCVGWWSFEIGSFLAGLISVVELGGQAIMMGLLLMTIMPPIGFGVTANVRIGSALGAGDIEQAKKTCKVVLICTALGCLLVSSTLLALQNVIGYMFTKDRDIAALVSKVILLFAPFHMCDGINQACGGILRGTGRQRIGAITNMFCYYLVGLPVGITLMFVAKLGIIGLWTGMFCSGLMQNCIYIPYILHINWQEACDEARIRAGVKPQKVSDPRNPQTGVLKSEFVSVENRGTAMSDVEAIALHDMASGEDRTKQLELKDDLPIQATNVVGEILSTKQLVVQRGLAVLLSISTLLVGITVRLITSKR